MPITYSLDVAPPNTLVTLEAAKEQMYVDHNDDDAYIQLLINVAERYIETSTEMYLGTQTFTLYLDRFPSGYTGSYSGFVASNGRKQLITILKNPVKSITTIKYLDGDGVQQTIDASDYILDANTMPARLVPASGADWPSTQDTINAVEIEFIAGYADIEEMNERKPMLSHAVKLLVGEWYENREAAQDIKLEEIPHGVKNLLSMSGLHTYT